MFTVNLLEQAQEASRPLLVDLLPPDTDTLPTPLLLLQNSHPRKSKQLKLHSENERVVVECQNFGPTCTSTGSSYAYALVAVDENNNRVDVIGPCERMTAKRTVKALERAVDKAAAPTPVDYKQAQTALGEAFGTKKRRQAIHSVEKNQIDMERLQSSSAAFINRAIDDAIVSRLPTPAPSDSAGEAQLVDDGVLPPYCMTAEKVSECYPVDRLIPASVYQALPSFNSPDDLLYSLTPCELVSKAVRMGTFSERQFMITYLSMLLKLFPLKESAFNDQRTTEQILFGLSTVVQTAILDSFGESVSTADSAQRRRYKLPSVKKDRLALHICALSLHLFNYELIVNELADALHISVTKVITYLKALGCAVEVKDGNTTVKSARAHTRVARLQVPLVFPKPKRQ